MDAVSYISDSSDISLPFMLKRKTPEEKKFLLEEKRTLGSQLGSGRATQAGSAPLPADPACPQRQSHRFAASHRLPSC